MRPNGLELSCPAEAGNTPVILAHPDGPGAPPYAPARRVSFSELLGRQPIHDGLQAPQSCVSDESEQEAVEREACAAEYGSVAEWGQVAPLPKHSVGVECDEMVFDGLADSGMEPDAEHHVRWRSCEGRELRPWAAAFLALREGAWPGLGVRKEHPTVWRKDVGVGGGCDDPEVLAVGCKGGGRLWRAREKLPPDQIALVEADREEQAQDCACDREAEGRLRWKLGKRLGRLRMLTHNQILTVRTAGGLTTQAIGVARSRHTIAS